LLLRESELKYGGVNFKISQFQGTKAFLHTSIFQLTFTE
jgi:hypothetical protein